MIFFTVSLSSRNKIFLHTELFFPFCEPIQLFAVLHSLLTKTSTHCQFTSTHTITRTFIDIVDQFVDYTHMSLIWQLICVLYTLWLRVIYSNTFHSHSHKYTDAHTDNFYNSLSKWETVRYKSHLLLIPHQLFECSVWTWYITNSLLRIQAIRLSFVSEMQWTLDVQIDSLVFHTHWFWNGMFLLLLLITSTINSLSIHWIFSLIQNLFIKKFIPQIHILPTNFFSVY